MVSSSLPSGEVNPSSGAPGNPFGHCKDNGNGHPNQQPAGCTTAQLVFGYTHDARGLVSGYAWDASSNFVSESVSDDVSTPVRGDVSTPVRGDGFATQRAVNAVNQVTSVVEDPFHLPSVHTTSTAYGYDPRGNRTSEATTRVTGAATHVVGKVTHTFDGMDLWAARRSRINPTHRPQSVRG